MNNHLRVVSLVMSLGAVSSLPGLESNALAAQENSQKAILVTGASTGIGRKITEVLAANGYFVYAGARKARDLQELNEIDNVQSIRLDVTIQEEIDAAVRTITKEGRGLFGLVNNAGVGVVGPMIEVTEEDLDFIFDVNVYGPYRITKAFSPLIIEQQGRITTIGSISGTLAGPLSGPYSMTKHAMEAFSDSLAAEMGRLDVKVSIVEPGNYQSQISSTAKKRMLEQNRNIDGSLFARQMKGWLERPSDRSQFKEPDEVAEAVLHALSSDDPKMRYMVVPDQREAEFTIKKAIQRLVQQNEKHQYAYDRDELVAMLDEALAQ